MKRKSKKPNNKKGTENEFEEIMNLKLKKEPKITKEDIIDFQIDFGLYNQTLEKNLAVEKKKTKTKGKKKCVKRQKTTGKKFIATSKTTKKDLGLKALSTL